MDSRRTNNPCSSPHHGNVARLLWADQGELEYESFPIDFVKKRRSFNDAWSGLQDLLGNKYVVPVDEALEKLRSELATPFENEDAFDLALFNAFEGCLKVVDDELNEKIDKNYFLVKLIQRRENNHGDGKEYAVGLARHNTVVRDLYFPTDDAAGTMLSENSASGPSNDSKPDHAVCLFEKQGIRGWKVRDCFAVVELKTSDTSCAEFEPDAVSDGHIAEPNLKDTHCALGQALLYTLGGVLPFHARRGVLGQSLPVAILAGLKKVDDSKTQESDGDLAKVNKTVELGAGKGGKKDDNIERTIVGSEPEEKRQRTLPTTGKLQWVSASIGIPEDCGGQFTYIVRDYERFCSDPRLESQLIEQALVLYIETITFGLRYALNVLVAIEKGDRVPPKPASGQSLKIGEQVLFGCAFCASPIHQANSFVHLLPGEKWKITQGELFAGVLNLRRMFDDDDPNCVNFLDHKTEKPDEARVLVKVSSRTVHFPLIDPFHAFVALDVIRLKAAASKIARWMSPEKKRVMRASAVLLNEFGSVLYAAVKTSAGMLTIMSDLSAQGYTTLSAADHRGKLPVLWEGFQNLVKNVLLPMARMGIIHADIRPGFDETSNVLCKLEGEGTAEMKASLKLIDYESVVKISVWKAPVANGSYIEKQLNWSATTFVWWQCLAIAHAWKNNIVAKTYFEQKGNNSLVLRLTRELTNQSNPLLPARFRQHANSDHISEQVVVETLTELANHFG